METITNIINTILFTGIMTIVLVFFIGINIVTIKEIHKAFKEDGQREMNPSNPV